MFCTSPPRLRSDLMRSPVSTWSPATPDILRLLTLTLLTPCCVKLPIDIPCPPPKWLFEIVMLDDGAPPAPIATLSSPSLIDDSVMVTFVALPGSMPSVLRHPYGVSIVTPQNVRP